MNAKTKLKQASCVVKDRRGVRKGKGFSPLCGNPWDVLKVVGGRKQKAELIVTDAAFI